MSMYNLLFGQNPNSDVILAILGLKENDVERFRDCGFDENGIYVYTRTGGGNREDYSNDVLTSNPYYLNDEDDDFDCTYATYYFKIPDEIKEDVEKFKEVRKNGITGKLIQWICKILEREKTENDIYSEKWEQQNKIVQSAKYVNLHESNGHTITTLDDYSTEKMLKLMEEAGGQQLSYYLMPYKVKVEENVFRWNFEKDKPDIERDLCRVKVEYLDKWEVDPELWQRWQKKFEKKYPNAIETIRNSISRSS